MTREATTAEILRALAAELASIPRPRRKRSSRYKRVTTLRPHEIDARAAPHVAQMRAEGLTRRQIAQRLNQIGPPPVSGLWTVRSVEALLRRMKQREQQARAEKSTTNTIED